MVLGCEGPDNYSGWITEGTVLPESADGGNHQQVHRYEQTLMQLLLHLSEQRTISETVQQYLAYLLECLFQKPYQVFSKFQAVRDFLARVFYSSGIHTEHRCN